MKRANLLRAGLAAAALCILSAPASAEVLALINYESKPAESLKAYENPVPGKERTEGIAVIDVDPNSANFGKIVKNIELPPDLVAHHIFYNHGATKAYVTALGKGELRVIDMTKDSLPMKVIDVPECQVGEDVVFSRDNSTWYLTCMGSSNVVIGDAVNDTKTKVVDMPLPYSHGIGLHEGIDRGLVTSTVRATDLGDPGDAIVEIRASTGEPLDTHRVSNKPSPGGEAPVEIVFVPDSNPPVAYITNMYGNSLWTATWDPSEETFKTKEAWNFANMALEVGVPLEIYFNDDATRLYVTTAKPGHLHIFDLEDGATKPKLVRSVATGEGAHHVGFNKDMSMAWVQNSLINLPGMREGTITVVDLKQGEAIATVQTFNEMGFNPNSIVLMPKWNNPAGH